MPDARNSRSRLRWRPLLRAVHRDLGYLAVGLTFVYALSGIAVNHIASWDPNFVNFEHEFQVSTPIPSSEKAAAAHVLREARIEAPMLDVYRVSDDELEITLEHSTLFVAVSSGKVYQEGQRPRPALRIMNWLHLNRGKKAWTFFADGYAASLLVLAGSGLFMIPGRKGLRGRGAVLVGLGIALPLAYLAVYGTP